MKLLEPENCISFWLPKLERSSLPVPRTILVKTEGEHDPVTLLDGQKPEGFETFILELSDACEAMGFPAFLRTGFGSDKHRWKHTCCVSKGDDLASHVAALVEWSHTVNPMGLPTTVWAVRQMLDVQPLFRVALWDGFPVTREFRFFVRDGKVVHRQPYWPPDAFEDAWRIEGPPIGWDRKLEQASMINQQEMLEVTHLAEWAGRVVGGYWSVDLIKDRSGQWWITDMAHGEESFMWDPATGEHLEP